MPFRNKICIKVKWWSLKYKILISSITTILSFNDIFITVKSNSWIACIMVNVVISQKSISKKNLRFKKVKLYIDIEPSSCVIWPICLFDFDPGFFWEWHVGAIYLDGDVAEAVQVVASAQVPPIGWDLSGTICMPTNNVCPYRLKCVVVKVY